MQRKLKPPADPEQLKRFKEMAREVDADESEGALDRAFGKVVTRSLHDRPARGPSIPQNRSRSK